MQVLNSYVSHMAEKFGVPITYEVVSIKDIELERAVREDGHIKIFELSDTDSSISIDILANRRSFPYVSAASVDRPERCYGQLVAQLGHNVYLFVPLSRIFEYSLVDPAEIGALWQACLGTISTKISAAATLAERVRLRKFIEASVNTDERATMLHNFSTYRRGAEQAELNVFKNTVLAERQARLIEGLTSSMSEIRHRAHERMRGIERMRGSMFESIEFSVDGFSIVSKPATILYDGRLYNFGRFLFKATKSDSSYNYQISGHSENVLVRGYLHPHVSTSGVCMGNVSSDFGTALANGDIETIIVLLVNLLNSYSPENPFLAIENWQHDYNPFQEYIDCFSSADPTLDCNSCSDGNCPHFRNRFDRCWASILEEEMFDDCIACGRCQHSSEAERRAE